MGKIDPLDSDSSFSSCSHSSTTSSDSVTLGHATPSMVVTYVGRLKLESCHEELSSHRLGHPRQGLPSQSLRSFRSHSLVFEPFLELLDTPTLVKVALNFLLSPETELLHGFCHFWAYCCCRCRICLCLLRN